jgi:hypothetical protein
MELQDVEELHFICPLANLESVCERGILCHEGAKAVPHNSVAMAEIQDRRANKQIPGGSRLHEYANLYFDARNPMMFKRRAQHVDLVVVAVSAAVLSLPNVVIADGNASSNYTAFWPSPAGLAKVSKELVYAEDWRDADQIAYFRRKSARCAEVLVPKLVPVENLTRVLVSCEATKKAVQALNARLPVEVRPNLFFQ